MFKNPLELIAPEPLEEILSPELLVECRTGQMFQGPGSPDIKAYCSSGLITY